VTTNPSIKIAVLGAGSWGSALATHLARNQHNVYLWGRAEDNIEDIESSRENKNYLPGIKLPDNLTATTSMTAAIQDAEKVLIVTPSYAFRSILLKLKEADFNPEAGISWGTKGLEQGSNKLLHKVAEEEFGSGIKLAMLSGPTFALEVAKKLPTAITVAANNPVFARRWSKLLSSNYFRAYTSDDIIGAEIAAACKNIIAIAAGISDGLGYGSNARSAIITRGLHEIMLLGDAYGAHEKTFMGLSGIGDLTLTCSDDKSRNRRLGLLLAKGMSIDEAKREIGQSVEGIHAAKIICQLAADKRVDMPISIEILRIIVGAHSPRMAASNLMQRTLKPE